MHKQFLVVKGTAGLGNRLSTLCAAIEYAQSNDRILLVDWGDGCIAEEGWNFFSDYFDLKGVDYTCSFQDLKRYQNLSVYPKLTLDRLDAPTYEVLRSVENAVPRWWPSHAVPKGRFRMLKRYWNAGANSTTGRIDPAVLWDRKCMPYGSDMPARVRADVVLFADFNPVFQPDTLLAHVRLKAFMEQRLSAFVDHVFSGQEIVGVHVRSTDKKPSRSISTLIQRIRDMGLAQTRIFLATDSKAVAQQFREAFSDLAEYPKELPTVESGGIHQWGMRNNNARAAMDMLESSIVDMYALSRCDYLFYQGNSSFSRISAMLHPDQDNVFDWLA